MDSQQRSFAQFARDVKTQISQEGESIDVIGFLSALQTYQEGRDFCLANKDIVEELLLDPAGARDTILQLLDRPAVFTSPEHLEADVAPIQQEKAWAQLEGSLPTRPASPATTEAFGIVQQALEKNKKETNNARSIVQEFNKRVTKIQAYGTTKEETAVINEKKQGPLPTFEDIRKELQAKTAKSQESRKEAEILLAEYEPFLRSEEYAQLRATHTIVETVLETPEVPTKVFVDAVYQGRSKKEAVSLAYAATVVNTPSDNGKAVTGAQKAMLDVVTTVFPGAQHASLELMAANTWTTLTSSNTGVKKLADAIGTQVNQAGTAIVENPEFINFIKKGNEAMTQKRQSSGSALSGLGRALSRPPVRISEEDVLDYAALAYQKNPAAQIDPMGLVAAKGLEFIHLDIGGLPLEWMAKWAAKKEAGAATKTAIGAAAGLSAKQVVGAAFLTRIGLTTLAGTAIAGPVGAIVSWVGSELLIKAWDGAKYLLSGAMFSSVFSDRGPDWKDSFFLAPFIIIAILPVLFILPSPINVIKFDSNKERAAFVQDLGGGGIEIAPSTSCLNPTLVATPNQTGGTPSSIQYSASVSPTCTEAVSISGATVSFSIYSETGSLNISTQTISGTQLQNGPVSFTIPVGSQYNNTVISATLTVTGTVGTTNNLTGYAYTSTVLGNPATGCFVFGEAGVDDAYLSTPASSSWGDRSTMLAAIAQLQRSPALMIHLCKGGDPNGPDIPIYLYRINARFGGGSAMRPDKVFIYDGGAGGGAVYTLAHEAGHVLNYRTGLQTEFINQAISKREGYIYTYPNCYSDGEDFAETVGLYVVWRTYGHLAHAAIPSCGRPSTPGGVVNYKQRYPLHYQFAQSIFNMEY